MRALPADLSSLTFDELRAKPLFEVEVLIEELEAELVNIREATQQNDPLASRLLAIAHTLMGDHELAAPHATAALAKGTREGAPATELAEMFFVLGVDAEKRDAQDEALEQYERALVLDPKCWRALFHTGKIALSFGWAADAVDYFRQVETINPEFLPAQAFLSKLDEAGVDVDRWQAGEDVDGDDAADEEQSPPEAPGMPEGMKDFTIE